MIQQWLMIFFLLTSGEVIQHSNCASPAYSGGQEVWTAPIPSATEESGRSHTSARYGSLVVGVFFYTSLCLSDHTPLPGMGHL